MKPIYIDFAPRSVKRSVLQTSPLTWLFAGIGLLLCAGAVINMLVMLEKHALVADAQRIQAQKAEGTKLQSIRSAWSVSEPQANSVNNAIAQLNLPWRDLLDAIESATPANIALLSIEPDSKKQTIKGTAESKNSQEMIAYIEQLKKHDFFGAVVLTKHEINDQDVNRPYRFQFEAEWKSDGREGL
jgi:Tfp pilus assembly protein PilN